jgi:serine/threonine-protein kinase RsbW
MDAMQKVTAGLSELLQKKRWPENEILEVDLAVQEALANAIRHGCKNDRTKMVQCCMTFDATGELVIVVKDPGPGFDLNAVPNPLEGDNVFKGSGRGVFLINQLMDTAEFTEGGRKVLMRKRPSATTELESAGR